MNQGVISIVDQEVWVHIGITPEEQKNAQKLLITTTLIPEQSLLGLEDKISNTLNYFEVYEAVSRISIQRNRNLLETLAEDIISTIQASTPNTRITIEIKKFILPHTSHVSVLVSSH